MGSVCGDTLMSGPQPHPWAPSLGRRLAVDHPVGCRAGAGGLGVPAATLRVLSLGVAGPAALLLGRVAGWGGALLPGRVLPMG